MHSPDIDSKDKLRAVMTHMAPLLGYSIGVGQILIALGVYFGQRKASDFVREHAREALNFHITVTLYLLTHGAVFIAFAVPLRGSSVSNTVLTLTLMSGVIGVVTGYLTVAMALFKAASGQPYRYLVCLRLVQQPVQPV